LSYLFAAIAGPLIRSTEILLQVGGSMAIEFQCPKGHKLKSPEDRAGRPGKCPKCGAPFVVPSAEVAEGIRRAAGQEPANGSSSDVGRSTKSGKLPANAIVFLCPNGHRLNGPASLQGRAGQCPHCGVKFRIPALDEDEEPLEFAGSRSVDLETFGEESEDDVVEFPDLAGMADEPEPLEEIHIDVGDGSSPGGVRSAAAPPHRRSGGSNHPIKRLLERLWEEKRRGASIQIDLGDGEILSPQWYSPEFSQETHGLFATGDSGNGYTLVAVPWSAIRRIDVTHVEELAEDFE
jgi:hypothetical protein